MDHSLYDVAVIGGGLSGTSIAAEAATRGAKTLLVERDDLGAGASSHCSQLFLGGAPYLENLEFSLVSHCLNEQRILERRAPHLIKHHECLMPESPYRHNLVVKAGLTLYKLMGAKHWSTTSTRLTPSPDFLPNHSHCFRYHDCTTRIPRLVIANALEAARHNARILPHHPLKSAVRHGNEWHLEIVSEQHGTKQFRSKTLINVTGAEIVDIAKKTGVNPRGKTARFSSLFQVIPRLYEGNQITTLQLADQQLLFIIPWSKQSHLVGGIEESNDLFSPDGQKSEIQFALKNYFDCQIRPEDIQLEFTEHFSSYRETNHKQRPSRNFFIDTVGQPGEAPFINVSGGLASTHRIMAEQCINSLDGWLRELTPSISAETPLPGGDIENADIKTLRHRLANDYPELGYELLSRLSDRHGMLTYKVLGNTNSEENLGKHFGHQLFQKEVEYFIQKEWATSAEDILERRSTLAKHFTEEETVRLQYWIDQNLPR